MYFRGLALILVLVAWNGDLRRAGQTAEQHLEQQLNRIITHDDFRSATWGVQVLDPATGRVLFEHDARRSVVPASNVKIYTTAAALDQLGPVFTVYTRLYGQGSVRDGVLEGNLFVRGAGDPTIADNLPVYGRQKVLETWASAIRNAGIERIAGDVIGDDDIFDDVAYPPGWTWDDLAYYYAPEISGLSYNQNVVDIVVRPGRVGAPGSIRVIPDTRFVEIKNETLTIPQASPLKEGYSRRLEENYFVVSSQVPLGAGDAEALAVHNPTLFFAHRLVQVLQEAGIGVTGKPVDVDELTSKPDYADPAFFLLAEHESPELIDVVSLVNKESHNLAAESLLKLLGVHSPNRSDDQTMAGSSEAGIERVGDTMARAGVDSSSVRLVDGSGLSRLNLVTAEATARMLAHMWNHADQSVREAFVSSLAVGGVDGKLRNRFRADSVHGRVRARTGTMTSVSSLSGYVETAGGRTLVFSLMCNNFLLTSQRVRAAQDAVVSQLARLP